MATADQKSNGRWLARYKDEQGNRHSAGLYDTKEEAILAAKMAEQNSIVLDDYFYEVWVPARKVSDRTSIGYQSIYNNHISPVLGAYPVASITQKNIRALLRPYLERREHSKAHTIKAVIGSVFKSLIEDEHLTENPAHGIQLPRHEADPFRYLQPEEFRKITAQLEPVSALFAKFLVGTGMRFGEAIEVRGGDFNGTEIIIRRRATRVGKKNSSDRVQVEQATKSGYKRVVPLSSSLAQMLKEHLKEHSIGSEDLVFANEFFRRSPKSPDVHADDSGVIHGTTGRYAAGCRCDDCRAAVAEYKRNRTFVELDHQEHLQHERWNRIWTTACLKSNIGWKPRTHDLRHAHATMLVTSGIDLFEVKERLGHRSISTTQIYLHRDRAAMEKAASATDVFL